MISCIIIEDQAPAQRVLKKYIQDVGTLELKAVFSNAIEALEYLKSHSIDLMFLDIHLPKISGIDFLKTIVNPPAVIFTTAFSDYAVQGYELNVVDYLVKPFSFERFVQAINKVQPKESVQDTSANLEFFVKSGHEYIKVKSEEVVYIQSDMDYTEIHQKDKKLLTPETLSFWENKLRANDFIRVHKSYLINTACIEKIAGNQVYLFGGIQVPIGRVYKDAFLGKYVKS